MRPSNCRDAVHGQSLPSSEFLDIPEDEDRKYQDGQDIGEIKPRFVRELDTRPAVGLSDEVVPSPPIAADTKQDIYQ